MHRIDRKKTRRNKIPANLEGKNKKVHISVLHLTAFLLVYLSVALLFLIFRGYTFLVMWMILTALLPCSFCMAWQLADRVEGNIFPETEIARPGDAVELTVSVHNSSYFATLRSTWLLHIGNSFYETYDEHKLILAIPPRQTRPFPMHLVLNDLGRIVFTCHTYSVSDLLGIFTICSDCDMESCLYILPRPENSVRTSLPEAHSGVAELSEHSRKGNDHSEISDIRTYHTGDRLKDIHWKLSAKNRELMVKERVSLSGSEHVLLFDLPRQKTDAERLLTEGYQQIRQLLDTHLTFRLLVWNQRHFSFDIHSVGCLADLDHAYCQIYCTSLPSRSSDLLHQYMRNCYPQLETYLCITLKEEAVQLEIWSNG